MNRRAAELGCTATHFTNVHGAFDREHYTSVRDFSKIALAAAGHEMLMDVCGTVAVDVPATEQSGVRALVNTNPLLSTGSVYGSGYRYEDADGMKTGYNRDAGYALVSTAARDGISLLCVAFGGYRDEAGFTSFADTVALFDWIFENYGYREVLPASENVASVDIAMGSDADYVNIRPAASIVALVPNTCTSQEFRREIRIYALENGTILTAPISSGQVIGEMTLYREEKCYGTVKLIASSSVELSRAQYIRSRLREATHNPRFFLIAAAVILFFGLYLVWVIVYRVRRIRHLRAVRAAEKAASAVAPTPAPTPMPKKEPRIILEPSLEDLDDLPEQKPAPIVELPKTRPAAPEAAAGKKAERDYFEEFFRPKK